jgi:NADH-quinone oxidoreductase subunit G
MVALKDLLATRGTTRIEARQDGAVFGSDTRSAYLFNSGLAGIERADVILLVGCNPRHEAPLLNVRLRKGAARGRSRVFGIGGPVDLTYPVTWLGDDAGLLADVPAELAAALTAAERPAIILGMGALTQPGVFGAARGLADHFNLVRDGWNGWNLLHTAAARVGALDLGLVADGAAAIVADPAVRALFLLGADEIDVGANPHRFTVYIGSHGDRGVKHADVILPAGAYSEKPGTWVNLEGRVQRALRAVFPPGDAREDWTILRALSAVLGQPLPYDDLPALRARIAAEWPHLAGGDRVVVSPGAAVAAGPAPAGALPHAIANYYLTNPIARASATMADCVAQLSGAATTVREAAE